MFKTIDKKIFIREYTEQQKQSQHYINDIQTLKTLKHKNILRLIQEYNSDNKSILLFEQCTPLTHTLHQPTLIYQLLAAIDYLHNTQHIIHCDISLNNILLSNDKKRIRLFNFKHSRSTSQQYTIDIPQATHQPPFKPWNKNRDIYAFACVVQQSSSIENLPNKFLQISSQKNDDIKLCKNELKKIFKSHPIQSNPLPNNSNSTHFLTSSFIIYKLPPLTQQSIL